MDQAAATTARQTYQARLQRVLAHIEAQLDQPLSVEALSVDALSAIAAFSKFHFHRQFSAAFGIGVGRFVQLARLKRAAYRLALRDDASVIEIALDAGYDGPEAFTRAFKRVIGQTPSAFRADPHWPDWHAAYQPVRAAKMSQATDKMGAMEMLNVKIVDFPATSLAVLEHRGDPDLIEATIGRFITWRKASGLTPPRHATFNLLYDNPEDTPPADFRLDIGVAIRADYHLDDAARTAGLVSKTIPAGRCATLRYQGSDDGFGAALERLYRDWLPQSGESLRDFPLFCQRLRFFPDVAEHEAVTDIFLPLQ